MTAIASLIDALPAEERAAHIRQLNAATAEDETVTRSGPVYGNVIDLFKKSKRRDWSTADVHRALTERNIETDRKTLGTTLSYLVKSGRIRRIARGHYVVMDGALAWTGIVTDEEIPEVTMASGPQSTIRGDKENAARTAAPMPGW